MLATKRLSEPSARIRPREVDFSTYLPVHIHVLGQVPGSTLGVRIGTQESVAVEMDDVRGIIRHPDLGFPRDLVQKPGRGQLSFLYGPKNLLPS